MGGIEAHQQELFLQETVPDTPVRFLERFGQNAGLRKCGHEIGIPRPTWHNMNVDMAKYTCSSGFTDV
jgi:hypothetical protein